jgi:tricorn protease
MLKTRKVERFAEGVASFDLSFNGERMLVQLKRAEPGGDGGRKTPAQWVLTPAGMPLKCGEGIIGLAGAEVRVDPLAEWKQIYREVWRIEGAISTMLTCMVSTPPRWRKNTSHTWKPWPRATT